MNVQCLILLIYLVRIGRAMMFACVRGVGEEEDVERQMGLGFGLAGRFWSC